MGMRREGTCPLGTELLSATLGIQSQVGKHHPAGRAVLGPKGLGRVASLKSLHRALFLLQHRGWSGRGATSPSRGHPTHSRPSVTSTQVTGCLAQQAESCS